MPTECVEQPVSYTDRGIFNRGFLTYKNTLALRAFAIIFIIFAHTQDWAGFYFSNLASIMVGLFFFLSGYGLTISKIKKPNYLATFNRRRWASVVIPTITTSALAFCIYLAYGSMSIDTLYGTLYRLFSSPISGFIYQLLVFYLLFYISNKIFKERGALILVWIGSILLLFANIGGYNLDYNYEVSFLFAIGATFAVYDDRIYTVVSKNYIKTLLLVGILFFIACINFSLNVKYDVTYNFVSTTAVLFLLLVTIKKPEYNYRLFVLFFSILVVMYWFWPSINMGGLNIMRDIFLIAACSSILNHSSGKIRRIFDIIGSCTLEMYLIHWSLFLVVWPITSNMGEMTHVLTIVLMLLFTLGVSIPMHHLNSHLVYSHKKLTKRFWEGKDSCVLYAVTISVIIYHYLVMNLFVI